MKVPFAGHNTMRRLLVQGILPEISYLALEGKLTAEGFDTKLRVSRGVQAVARILLNRASDKGHPNLVLEILSQLEKSKSRWNLPRIKGAAQEAIKRAVPHS